jgi:hypothetical protein
MVMRTFLISAALLSAAAMTVAAPASAQYRGQGGYGYGEFRGGGIERELAEIRQQIRISFDRGLLSRGEAARLTRDADRIDERLHRRAWEGLNFRDREDLQRRIQTLRERLRFERFDGRRDRYDRRW